MKRTCNGCKALDQDKEVCNLGYRMEKIGHHKHTEIAIDYKPLEECPKPKTITEYVQLYCKLSTK